jgi:hypothetical protein
MKFLVVVQQIERGIEGIFDKVADDHAGDLDLQSVEDTDDQIMGKGAGRLDIAQRQGY